MLKVILLTLGIVAVSIALLAIKLLFGKRFVNLHIDGNKALNRKGIHCVQSMDATERKENPNKVSEHNNSKKKS